MSRSPPASVLGPAAAGWAASAILAVATTACTFTPIETCGIIPDGGCPIGRGGTCDDPSCTGLYDCRDGDWAVVTLCDGGGGGGSGSTGSMSMASSVSTGGCTPAKLDHTGETDGCAPMLESPDCPVAAAELCNPCLTGCIDFFLCTAQGWKDLAYCTEESELVILQ